MGDSAHSTHSTASRTSTARPSPAALRARRRAAPSSAARLAAVTAGSPRRARRRRTAPRSASRVSPRRPRRASAARRLAPPAGVNRRLAQTLVSNSGLYGLNAEPAVPSMCQRGSGRRGGRVDLDQAGRRRCRNRSARGRSRRSRCVQTLPRSWAKTRTRLGRPEQPPELVDEVAAPVVEPPAAEAASLRQFGRYSFAAGPTQLRPLAEAALDVDQLPERARLDRGLRTVR